MLVVMVQYVGHEGGVVGQPLAHAQGDGLTGEQAVAPRRRIHRDGNARRQHGHGQRPQEIHDWSVQRRKGQGPRGTAGQEESLSPVSIRLVHQRREIARLQERSSSSDHREAVWVGQRNPTRPWLKLAASIAVGGGGFRSAAPVSHKTSIT